jgi:hypothetical protein
MSSSTAGFLVIPAGFQDDLSKDTTFAKDIDADAHQAKGVDFPGLDTPRCRVCGAGIFTPFISHFA